MLKEKIGRYRIKSEIGRGGMATVYHAYDPNFERDVAIKILPQAYLHDPQFRERFEREAKMIASLEHPAIVPVYDFGEEDGQPFIVMRYMAGSSLADRLQQGALSVDETARIISRLAPALDAAHARGIIHRDLKPGNVLFDQYGNAFLSDFGIARIVQESAVTLTGENIIGTPAYMSPEQVQGDKAIDGRSDTYALGVLVYQMLTGQVPYRSETSAKVMMMHLLEPVPNIRAAKEDLPSTCERVIEQAMAKNPDDRFSTAGELATALDLAARGEDSSQVTRILGEDQTVISQPKTSSSPPQDGHAIPSTQPGVQLQPVVHKKGRSSALIFGIIVIILLCGGTILFGGFALWDQQVNGSLAMFAPATVTYTYSPSDTPILPSLTTELDADTATAVSPLITPTSTEPTLEFTETPEVTITSTPPPEPKRPVIGGADMIAYLVENDIWIANLDGSDFTRLTEDGAQKINLQWAPDGEAIVYITGYCAQSVQIADGRVDIITCFNFVDSFKSFEISPDGSQVAISLDNQLYLVPYDTERLSQASTRTDLTEIAECKDFAPYQKNYIKSARWSDNGKVIAADLIANVGGGKQGDIIQLIPVDQCLPNPSPLDNFPPPRFEMSGYVKNPIIQNYSWDGLYLFALTNNVRNDGFGDLYIYNTDLHKARQEVNPIEAACCYRDPSWSPDGSHLVLAFQDYLGGANSITQLYMIPYGSLGTGAKYTPLPLPEISDPRAKPYPILRPAKLGE